MRIVAAIDRQQRHEAPAEETSAREQRTGDGDLRAHQQSTEPRAAGACPSLVAAAMPGERLDEAGAAQLEDGNQAGDDA